MSTDAQTVVAKETLAADPKIVLNELDSSASEGKKFTFSPLFEAEKTLTEAELRGEAPKEEPKPEEKTEAKAESKTEEKAPDEKPADSTEVEDKAVADKGTEGEPKSDAKPEEKSQDQGKPPKGFVPHQALAEERRRRQTLGAAALIVFQGLAPLEPARLSGGQGALLDNFRVLRDRSVLAYVLRYAAHCWELFGLRSWMVAFILFGYSLAQAERPALGATEAAAIINFLGIFTSTKKG